MVINFHIYNVSLVLVIEVVKLSYNNTNRSLLIRILLYSPNLFVLTSSFLTNFISLTCKEITFCVNFHRFFLTIGSFLQFSAAENG